MTSERQAYSKESREQRAELWSRFGGWDEQRGTEGWRQSKVTNRERE